MKINVRKITSVTVLTSMLLTNAAPFMVPETAYASETELAAETEKGSKAVSETITEVLCETEETAAEMISLLAETEPDTIASEADTEKVSEAETKQEAVTDTSGQKSDTEKSPVDSANQKEELTEAPSKQEKETKPENETKPEAKPEKETKPSKEPEETEKITEKETSLQETDTEAVTETEKKEVKVRLSMETPDELKDGEIPGTAGTTQYLRLAVMNETAEDAMLRLSFWDYYGEERDGRNIPKELLYDPCEQIEFPTPEEYVDLAAYGTDGNTLVQQIVFQEEQAGDSVTEKYLSIQIPSEYSLEQAIPLTSEQDGKVVISTEIISNINEAEYDPYLMIWTSAPEVETESMLTEAADTSDGEVETDQKESIQEESALETEEKLEIPEDLSETEFASKRLMVMTADPEMIRKEDEILESYGDIYLLGFDTVEESMEAYVYYKEFADAVEPDSDMEIASDGSDEVTENNNTDAALSEKEGAVLFSDGVNRIIALLDTGTSASANVIDRVSLIDSALEGHSHGSQMAAAITGQNPDAQILSVRVMGNDGRGAVSDIIAGMEYAMEHGASIINLSLSSRKNMTNSVLDAEIRKAAQMGILVVGAAGNNAADVCDYMPGSVADAWIIGACNESGVRLSSSNYGSTVDYNVIAGTTSEAAAKFSGLVSRAGIEGLRINEGILYTTDYVADAGEQTEPEETEADEDYDVLPEDELNDMAGTEEDGIYPGKGSSVSKKVKLWIKDTDYDFAAYSPYSGDENVVVTCVSEQPEYELTDGARIEMEYKCTLADDESYYWNLHVTFIFTEERSLVNEGSDLFYTLMPERVNQERNAGYGGIVPEYMGATVAGREFTVLKDDTSFDVYGLLIDYNPETFKVNNVADDGGFDVSKAGTYTVTYEMSYFLYPEYTWFVANKVNVVDKESLEAGIYLTSTESTLMFKGQEDEHYWGYGDLVKVKSSEDIFTIRCIDPEYEFDITSSSETVGTECCAITDQEDGSKILSVALPEELTEAVVFSMYRPGYESAKFFTGGGWADGEEHNLEETAIDHLTEEEMQHFEDTVLGKIDENDEDYMEIAASWTTVENKNISGKVKTGSGNTTNNSWVDGTRSGCNYGTAQITDKKNDIAEWITSKGYDIDTKDLSNFRVNCSSGHDYLGLWPNKSYSVTFKCYIQKSGDNYRLKITCSLHPGSDQHGNYQSFYGSKVYTTLTNGAKLRVYKRFQDPALIDAAPDRYGQLKTTFSIYPASAYNTTTKVLDRTVEPEDTIYLDGADEDTVYGDSDILDPGTYYVVETRRIMGCTANTDIYGPVVIEDSDSGVIKLHDKVKNTDYASMASNNWIYNYPMYFNGKILTKTDDSGNPVKDAIYSVQFSTAKSVEEFKVEKTWYFKTDDAGILSYDFAHYVANSFTYNGKTYKSDEMIQNVGKTVPMLPYGIIKIKEIKPPSDIYEIDTNVYTIELVSQTDAAGQYTIRKLKVKENIPTSVDKLRYWKLTVEKKSKASDEVLGLGSYSLAGATFGVFSDQACTKRVQLYSDAKLTAPVANNVFTTDSSGKTSSYYLKAGNGTATYYVKELTAPKGHQLVSGPVSITVTMPADALKVKTASFTNGFSEPYDYMELDALVEKLSMHGNPVKNVVFKVCYYDDKSANAGQLKKTWYLISDDLGKVMMDQNHVYAGDASMKSDAFYTDPESKKVILPVGGYLTIQEAKAPAQYKIDDTVQGFETKKQKLTVTRKYNELIPCRIRLKKYDKTGAKPLAGVQFELKYVKAAEKDTSLAGKYSRLLKEGETKILTTDSKGEISFDNLDQGTYEITEVKTVAGQTLLKEKIKVDLPITMTKAEADSYGNVDFTTAKEDKGYSGKWFFFDCLYEITNEPQFKIPRTGGLGGWMFGYIGIGILVLTGTAFFVLLRRRKSV